MSTKVNTRIWHAVHTKAEPKHDGVTIEFDKHVVKRIRPWFTGEFGLVKHSCMPQDPTATGIYSIYFDLYRKWSKKTLGFTLLEAIERNVIKIGDVIDLDGDSDRFPTEILSIHPTPECGWEGHTTPEDFLAAYKKLRKSFRNVQKRISIGHMMFYAWGDTWTKRFVDTLQLFSKSNIVVGIFLGDRLSRKPVWEKEDLYHPTKGLTILQPWALPYVQKLPSLKLTLDWDAHKVEDMEGFTERNLKFFCEILDNVNILSRFEC